MSTEAAAESKPSPGVGWLSDVVVDCSDPERLAAFWGSLLGLEVAQRIETYVMLARLSGGLAVGFQRVPEPKVTKNRIHLDLTVPDLEAATRRVEELGGRRIGDVKTWRVMRDPESNEFCLLPEEPG